MKTARKGRQSAYISIRSKLVAAVAMLLVASFMVVSSSYAWFTLSTAPEVKGITTTVGSNGNLEIALYTGDAITSQMGDANKSDAEKNVTWGNLINLSGTGTTYGLELIKLYPTRLNVANNQVNQVAPLKTPKYAADGRVEALEETTLFGTYNSEDGKFLQYDSKNATSSTDPETVVQTQYGVRGIGSSTGMTVQQSDYAAAKAALTAARSSAKAFANQSLQDVGSDLASIAADHALGGNGPYNLTNVGKMITSLENAVVQIDTMILAYAQAQFAKDSQNLSADDYNTKKAEKNLNVTDVGAVSDDVVAGWVNLCAGNSSMSTVLDYRTAIKNAVTTAKTNYGLIGDPTAGTWADLTSVLGGLVDLNTATFNGLPMSELTKKENGNYVNIGKLTNASIVTVVLKPTETSGTNGVYIDIANLCGNVSANIEVSVSIGGIDASKDARMVTEVTPAPFVDLASSTVFPQEPVKNTNTGDDVILDTLYGYALDLAFRTNAAGSSLKLQSTPVNRIYAGDTSEATMGYGSCMVFNYSEEFDENDVADLMAGIRVVFATSVNTAIDGNEDTTGTILAVGGLDTSADAIKTTTLNGLPVLYAPLRLYADAAYTLTANGFRFIDGVDDLFLDEDKAEIMALAQNQTERLTVYVYLDGDVIDNGDVIASGAVGGQLNLQFSSTADLVPMTYSPLKTPAAPETPDDSGSGEVQEPENGENS